MPVADIDPNLTHSGSQPLNSADRLMLIAHRAMRGVGHGGFQCQSHVWLAGRIDAERLGEAIGRLAASFPVITGRLEEGSNNGVPRWRFDPQRVPQLQRAALPTDDPAEARAYGEKLFVTPMDLDRDAPISFHLLRQPGGRDVFILHFSHVLMDGKAPEFVLRELSRCHEAVASEGAGPAESIDARPRDEMSEHLFRYPRNRRIKAALSVIRQNIRLPGKPIIMTPPDQMAWGCEPYGIEVHALSAEQTRQVERRARAICGFVNLTPLILASAFRVVARLSRHPQKPGSIFRTDVPLNLRAPGRADPIFRNFMSFIQLEIRRQALEDRDRASKLLHDSMRDQIRRSIELGNLQMMSWLAPREKLLERHIRDQAEKQPATFGFGFLGPVIADLETFCGQPTSLVYTLNSALSPPGVTLQVNQYRGCLHLMATYIVGPVSRAGAGEFLSAIAEDLCGE